MASRDTGWIRMKTINRNPTVGNQSKLVTSESYTDPKMTTHIESCVKGSRELCAAILKTGKLYRKMTPAEQLDARAYAYGPDLVDKRTWK
jgi:hypothetical protein